MLGIAACRFTRITEYLYSERKIDFLLALGVGLVAPRLASSHRPPGGHGAVDQRSPEPVARILRDQGDPDRSGSIAAGAVARPARTRGGATPSLPGSASPSSLELFVTGGKRRAVPQIVASQTGEGTRDTGLGAGMTRAGVGHAERG